MKIENNLLEGNVRVRLLFMYYVSWNLTEKEKFLSQAGKNEVRLSTKYLWNSQNPQRKTKKQINKQARQRRAIKLNRSVTRSGWL
jgi:hypothetical protein